MDEFINTLLKIFDYTLWERVTSGRHAVFDNFQCNSIGYTINFTALCTQGRYTFTISYGDDSLTHFFETDSKNAHFLYQRLTKKYGQPSSIFNDFVEEIKEHEKKR